MKQSPQPQNIFCICKQSEHLDETWRPFMVLDKHCLQHGYEIKQKQLPDIVIKPTAQHCWSIENDNAKLLTILEKL